MSFFPAWLGFWLHHAHHMVFRDESPKYSTDEEKKVRKSKAYQLLHHVIFIQDSLSHCS